MVIDTNIIIAFLNGDEEVIGTLKTWWEHNVSLLISTITVIEVLSFATLNTRQISEYTEFLDSFVKISLTDALGEEAASLRRMFGLSLPDSAIAATALHYRVPLVTRDKGFQKIPDLELRVL